MHFNGISMVNSTNKTCEVEYVEIFNGPVASSPSVGKYCGSTVPGDFLSFANDIRVAVHITTVGTVSGFSATYTLESAGNLTKMFSI